MGGGKFCGFRSRLRVLMYLGQGKIAKDKRHPLGEMFLQALDDGGSLPTGGTLLVAIFDEGDGCVRISLNVVFGAYCYRELGHTVAPNSSNAWRMPSAPGFTATGDR